MTRIIVFGSNGMLGRYVCSYLKKKGLNIRERMTEGNILEFSRKNFDIFKLFQEGKLFPFLQRIVNENKGCTIINCAGVTNKRADIGVEEMYIVNSLFPMFIDCLENCKKIHISTDCVFDGKRDGIYVTDDVPSSRDNYGLSKQFGERLRNTCVIRTSIIGEETKKEGQNYNLLEWVKNNKGKEVNGFTNHHWNGVTCLELAKIIYKNWIYKQFNCKCCITQVSSMTHITKSSLIKIISDVYDLGVVVKEVEATQSINRVLAGDIVSHKTFEEQLEEMKEFKVGNS